jgi:SSS family solute:Na+ symporter
MLPDFSRWDVAVTIFIIPLTVQWWSTWYPGSEPGGGSYVAQRMLAAKSERDAMAGTLFFNIAHYALRPWPWILVALASMLVFPQVSDIAQRFPHVDSSLLGHDMAYPAMLTFIPTGVLGVVVAGLLAAYVSTISTHLNWGTSYLVHDLYRRFLKQGQSEAHYVMVGRLVTALLMVVAGLFTLVLDTARDSFNLLLSVGAGTGLLYLLRWFWWRINAWSEIAAMASSFVLAMGLFVAGRNGYAIDSTTALIVTILVTTAVWVGVTYATAPTSRGVLHGFYRQVRPSGPGWSAVRAELGETAPAGVLGPAFTGMLSGSVMVYSALFGAGHLLFGHMTLGLVFVGLFVVSAAVLGKVVGRMWQT